MENQVNTQDHSDHELISNKLPALIILIIMLFIAGFIFMKNPHVRYRMTAQEMHEKAMTFQDVINPESLMDILYTKDTVLFRFIDLRSAHDYLNGHLPGAINIPVSKILEKEYADIFNQDQYINILYADDQCGACGPWMILSQLGYNNNKVLQGGYNFAKNHLLSNFSPMSGKARDEKAYYDFAKVMKDFNQTGTGSTTEIPATEHVAPAIVPSGTPKKKAEGGGC